MINNTFEAYKLKREIRRSGQPFSFFRAKVNEFGEPDGEPERVAIIKGLYHETNAYVQTTYGDGSLTRKKKQPMLLCILDEVAESGIEYDDEVVVVTRSNQMTSKTLKYVGMVDIQNWGIIADLSFEEVDDGNNKLV